MTRRMDWERVRVRSGQATYGVTVTDEVPTVLGPSGARRQYMKAVVDAVSKGRPLPQPSSVFLRYFRAIHPCGSIDEWVSAQPEYREAINRLARAKKMTRDR